MALKELKIVSVAVAEGGAAYPDMHFLYVVDEEGRLWLRGNYGDASGNYWIQIKRPTEADVK